jgi:hypothetical protein
MLFYAREAQHRKLRRQYDIAPIVGASAVKVTTAFVMELGISIFGNAFRFKTRHQFGGEIITTHQSYQP